MNPETPVVGADVVDESAALLGGRIRAFRRTRGLTLVELAEKTLLSHSFLSQLERGHARPSMSSLDRIAKALGSSQLELIAAAEDAASGRSHAEPEFVPAAGGVVRDYAGTEARMLLHGNAPFHIMEFHYKGTEWGDYFSHPEAEFIYVLEGIALVEVEGRPTYTIHAGDSLFYPGGAPHRWNALDSAGFHSILVKQPAFVDEHSVADSGSS